MEADVAVWPGTLWGGPWGSELEEVVWGEGSGLKGRGHGRAVGGWEVYCEESYPVLYQFSP